MNRRDWLRRAAIIVGGVIAADQLELIERLTPKRYVNGFGALDNTSLSLIDMGDPRGSYTTLTIYGETYRVVKTEQGGALVMLDRPIRKGDDSTRQLWVWSPGITMASAATPVLS
jgi:hypothetical protein